MRIGFGKYQDITAEKLLAVDPSYVYWLLAKVESGAAKKAGQYIAEWLLPKINARPIQRTCFHCRGQATYATAVASRSDVGDLLRWWCDECDPLLAGALDGRLTSIHTYLQLLKFCATHGATKGQFKRLGRSFFESKGLPRRLTAKALSEFYG